MNKKLNYILKTSADESKSPINKSPSKQLCFIPKSPRFLHLTQ